MTPDAHRSVLASSSLARHLTRGAVGFGLIGSAFALTPSTGAASLLLAPLGLVALRGCPTCWIVGLLQTISAGRLQRTCTDTGCGLSGRMDGRDLTNQPVMVAGTVRRDGGRH